MRLSSYARSILNEARRHIETSVNGEVVVIVVQPGDDSPLPDDGVTHFIIQLSDDDHPPVAFYNDIE
jgi:NAD(P)H-dependent FMN reductase